MSLMKTVAEYMEHNSEEVVPYKIDDWRKGEVDVSGILCSLLVVETGAGKTAVHVAYVFQLCLWTQNQSM